MELLGSRILNAVRKGCKSLPFAPRLALSGPIASDVPADVAEQLLAVVSEGLSNAVRHARAAEIDVAVTADDKSLSVTVSGVGCGMGSPTGRSGLANMEVRALNLDGVFRVDSAVESGTRFLVGSPGSRKSGQGLVGHGHLTKTLPAISA